MDSAELFRQCMARRLPELCDEYLRQVVPSDEAGGAQLRRAIAEACLPQMEASPFFDPQRLDCLKES